MSETEGVGRVLGAVEVSEWFDWMRRELELGGVDLPCEEIAVSFAAHALRLRDRLRDVYRHLPYCLEDRLIMAAIVYQCWKMQRDLRENTKWPGASRVGPLPITEALRYIRPVGSQWGYHLVEARDGFLYTVTVPSGHSDETIPASEVICNCLAGLLGLRVLKPSIVSVNAALLRRGRDARPGRPHRPLRRTPELCLGFRHPERCDPVEPAQVESRPLDARNLRHLLGALVLDVWTLNLLPREWTSAFEPATGRVESTLVDATGGLSGGDWAGFLCSTYDSLPAMQAVATKLKDWTQIERHLLRAAGMDLNPLWDLAFHMPPLWYGGSKQALANVLGKLGSRQWDLVRALYHFVNVGYLPILKLPLARAQADTETPELAPPGKIA